MTDAAETHAHTLADDIRITAPSEGSAKLWWLGGSGVAIKAHNGRVVYIDPYLSDAVERLHGFKRMMPPPISPGDVACDLVITTHEHGDHLDVDALPVIAANNASCRFAGPATCASEFQRLGIDADRIVMLQRSGSMEIDGVTIHTAPADHGEFTADAVAVVVELDGVRILHSGDTSLCSNAFKPLYALRPDVLLPCINGNFGNMNHIDAAQMAQQVQPQVVIPCHFWMFVEHGGDPAAFLHACKYFCPEVPATVLRPGEGLMCQRRP